MKKFNHAGKEPSFNLTNNTLMSLPTPTSISTMWNLGFLLGMTLMMQIITGLMLSMNYIPSTMEAFESIIHIMRDIESGWITRYMHMNTASLMFMLIYAHMARGVYFNSPQKQPLVWMSGILILLVCMGTAFMGYVLPWGQMSYWGATVITSMISAVPYIGEKVTLWVWGGFSISQPTLNRFFSIHFLLPMVMSALVLAHLALLHQKGSSNPTGTNPDMDKMKFFPYFLVKDMMSLVPLMMIMTILVSISPNMMGDVENFNMMSSTTTPAHIQPEWYFLFAYTILRAVPSKLGGVIAMMMAVTITLVLTMKKNKMNSKFSPMKKITFFCWVASALLLTWLGMNPVEEPFTSLSKTISMTYFSLSVML